MKEISEQRVFDFAFIVSLTKNESLASGTIQNYLKKGYIKRIKQNLYAAISIEHGGIIPSKYEIASNITKTSYVSLHSAFEYYGYYNQVFNTVSVSSVEQFRNFTFEYNEYECKRVNNNKYINTQNGIKVSTLSKTIVDSIDNIKTYDDFEELLEILKMITKFDSKEILDYLKYVDKKILYSKTGLILSFFEDGYYITEKLLDDLKNLGLKKSGYFTNEKHRLNCYSKEWKLHYYKINI